jgi:dTDP-4-amino-4,6-dideoxygalactose transaminase
MSAVVGTEIPFNALGRATAALRPQLDEAIARVLDSGWYVLGPEHDAFEAELAAYVGVEHAVGVGNGTDALQLALSALGVGAGDFVLTAANAGGYTSTAVRALGAVPIYADVDEASLLLTVETVDAAIAAADVAPKVVVVTHLFGAMAPVEAIVDWSRERGILVIEDCAQSLGARRAGRMAGSLADAATVSFYPTKNLGGLGDGGAVLTPRAETATALRQLRQYGWQSKYRAVTPAGRNSRLDEVQAAVLRVKLPFLDEWNARRREIHSRYAAAAPDSVRVVNVSSESYSGHLAVIEVADREAAQRALAERGIRTDVHYPIPDHLQPVAAGAGAPALPVTEYAAGHILSLPLFPELSEPEIDRICSALGEL